MRRTPRNLERAMKVGAGGCPAGNPLPFWLR
jgi:hypothetical protein